jgi:hypothetical protein
MWIFGIVTGHFLNAKVFPDGVLVSSGHRYETSNSMCTGHRMLAQRRKWILLNSLLLTWVLHSWSDPMTAPVPLGMD